MARNKRSEPAVPQDVVATVAALAIDLEAAGLTKAAARKAAEASTRAEIRPGDRVQLSIYDTGDVKSDDRSGSPMAKVIWFRGKAGKAFKVVPTKPIKRAARVTRILGTLAIDELPASPGFQTSARHAVSILGQEGFSENEIYTLVVPKRTLARRQAKKELLTVEETDKALRLARIAELADRVFGSREKSRRWLRKEKRSLGGDTPLDFLSSEAGARVVEEMLLRIDNGILA
ncbi:MAG TPA: antitoxin Xre/MbcA/ParS toxin-binding domain-containing protein [Xanthobacteraceae bacterium]|jgi:putative toxin-antitoxin system antitoxin component (TIGR02293 family)